MIANSKSKRSGFAPKYCYACGQIGAEGFGAARCSSRACASIYAVATRSSQEFFRSDFSPWIGVAFCAGGLGLLLWSLISFGWSFRVGIDTDRPDRLITSGIFAISRNPIYVAFAAVLVGQFLIFPNWILLVYMGAATWLSHRQILREEEYLKKHYGAEYANYCRRVRRYL